MELQLGLVVLGDILQLAIKARFGPFILLETGASTLAVSSELAPASGAHTHELVFSVASVTQAHERFKERIAFVNVPRAVNEANSFYGPQ